MSSSSLTSNNNHDSSYDNDGISDADSVWAASIEQQQPSSYYQYSPSTATAIGRGGGGGDTREDIEQPTSSPSTTARTAK